MVRGAAARVREQRDGQVLPLRQGLLAGQGEPRQRGVAVGEVVDVGIAFKNPGLWHLQPEPLESRVFATPCEQRRYRLALAREQVERASVEHRERTLVETVVTLQVGAVGGGRQQALFFGGTLAGEHVARVRV